MPEKIAYLSLGSNLGDRAAHLEAALNLLDAEILKRSSIYETEPQGPVQQSWFLNMVVECRTRMLPMTLLAHIGQIERKLGRKRLVAQGPRTCDIDILLYGEAVIKAPQLEIPHARLIERRFVLEPLAEIAPNLRHPTLGHPMHVLRDKVHGQQVRPYSQLK